MSREKSLLEQIQSGDQRVIEEVYILYKKDFVAYASRFSVNDEDVVDIYQDSIIVLYENIISGKLVSLTSSLKTYLFAIGKYKIYNSLKIKATTKERFSDYEFLFKEDNEEDFLLKEENIEKVQKGYQGLGTRCQEVLKMFYYENLSIEEIKNRLNYTSKDVVKSQKSRCIKQLKEIVLKLR